MQRATGREEKRRPRLSRVPRTRCRISGPDRTCTTPLALARLLFLRAGPRSIIRVIMRLALSPPLSLSSLFVYHRPFFSLLYSLASFGRKRVSAARFISLILASFCFATKPVAAVLSVVCLERHRDAVLHAGGGKRHADEFWRVPTGRASLMNASATSGREKSRACARVTAEHRCGNWINNWFSKKPRAL